MLEYEAKKRWSSEELYEKLSALKLDQIPGTISDRLSAIRF